MSISQIQLLGDLSLEDLLKMQNTKQTTVDEPVVNATERPFAWDGLHQPGQTVLKLGAEPRSSFFTVVREILLLSGPSKSKAPLDTVDTLAQFYFEKIKEAQPAGPYRIAGFSALSEKW
ncbi:hypothetical protein K438DRAFT_1974396 [Mycena galopus ATCC 62051]|nr:hypothetical protein K438DRAFT_1974396 [Mycena galopus ATCC 62051]